MLKRIRREKSHAGHARILSECSDNPVAYLARVQVEEIPSPYAYSPSVCIWRYRDSQNVVVFETSHKVYDVFEVPRELLRFKTEEQATDWHIRFCRKSV